MARILHFDVPEKTMKELDALMEEVGIQTKEELLDNALSMLEWVIEQKRSRRVVLAVDNQSENSRELYMPFFDNIK